MRITIDILRHASWAFLVACGLELTQSHASAADAAANWPQWRGPANTGISSTAKPPLNWSDANNIKWKAEIPGRGIATPIIWDNKVILQTAVPTGKKAEGAAIETHRFVVLCLDRNSGQTLWEQTAIEAAPHQGHHASDGSFASASPLTDGQHVYAFFGSRGLYCYDMDGKPVWSRQFGQMKVDNNFGEGSSPALCGDKIIINWDQEGGDSFIVALDKKTGDQKWKQARPEKTSWTTPLIVEQDGKQQIIVAGCGQNRAYDPASGDVIWSLKCLTSHVIPTPVWDNGVVFCAGGDEAQAVVAIKLGGKGELNADSIIWRRDKQNTPYVVSPLLAENRLYFFDWDKEVLTCVSPKDGHPFFAAVALPGLKSVHASPIAADGRIYIVSRNGATVVLKPSDKLEILATNKIDDQFDASPSVAGDDLFLRGKKTLYCISERK